MVEIETPHLKIVALDYESLILLKRDRILLEKHLDLNFTGHKVSSEVQDEIKSELHYRIEDVQENPEHFEWYTSWEIILKEQEESIGAIGFTALPDENGTSTFGFYIDERHRNRGYASEALAAMTQWAFKNNKLLQITANTSHQNKNSQKVLKKIGFVIVGTDNDMIYWELKRKV